VRHFIIGTSSGAAHARTTASFCALFLKRSLLGSSFLFCLASCILPQVSSAPLSEGATASVQADQSGAQANVPADTASERAETSMGAPAGMGENPSAVAGPSGECSPGSFSCDGNALKQCESDARTQKLVLECTSAVLCNPTAGRCDVAMCAPGSGQCNANRLRRCSDDGTAYVEEACAGKHCNEAAARCDFCEANSWKCESIDTRVQCQDGQAFVKRPCPAEAPYCYEERCFQHNECGAARSCPTPREECWTATCVEHRCGSAPDPSISGRTCTLADGDLGKCAKDGNCVR